MAKYTTEVRSICESLAGWDNHEEMQYDAGYSDSLGIIETARTKIFDFEYPIFDDSYKATLETKILKHYYFREIGAETYGQWKFWLNRTLNEIMPYYNQLYKSALLEFNPFYNSEHVVQRTDVVSNDKVSVGINDSVTFGENRGVTTSEESSKNESSGENRDKSDNWSAISDTPQGGLTGIAENRYLSQAQHTWANDGSKTENESKNEFKSNTEGHSDNKNKVESSGTVGSKDVYTGNDKYLEYVLGKTGSETYSEMLSKYRETFLNIDVMVLERLGDLFMKVW